MTTQNLTKSQFRIYLLDPNRILENIFWETCNGIGMTSTPINTSNGRDKYMIATRPQPKPLELSRASNIDDDFMIEQWRSNFCADATLIEGASQGTILMIVPLKACSNDEPHKRTVKVFNCVPTDINLFDADLMDVTAVSRTTLSLTYTRYVFN